MPGRGGASPTASASSDRERLTYFRDRGDPLVLQEGHPGPVEQLEAMAHRVVGRQALHRLLSGAERFEDGEEFADEGAASRARNALPLAFGPAAIVLEVGEEVRCTGSTNPRPAEAVPHRAAEGPGARGSRPSRRACDLGLAGRARVLGPLGADRFGRRKGGLRVVSTAGSGRSRPEKSCSKWRVPEGSIFEPGRRVITGARLG